MPNWVKCGHVEPNEARECITCLKLEIHDLREKMVEIHKLLFAPGLGSATPEVNVDKAWAIAGDCAEKQTCGPHHTNGCLCNDPPIEEKRNHETA